MDASSRHINMSGPLLKEKALKCASELGVENFKASNGWLDSFLKWNNTVFRVQSGERGEVDSDVVKNWKEHIQSVCEGYAPSNLFNMDKTGLFYRDTTMSTYFKKGETCSSGKRSKECITVALCASMTGKIFFCTSNYLIFLSFPPAPPPPCPPPPPKVFCTSMVLRPLPPPEPPPKKLPIIQRQQMYPPIPSLAVFFYTITPVSVHAPTPPSSCPIPSPTSV